MKVIFFINSMKYVIRIVLLPAYVWVIIHLKCITGLFNKYIRGLFNREFVTERVDLFWARNSAYLAIIYAFIIIKPIQALFSINFIHNLVDQFCFNNYVFFFFVNWVFNLIEAWYSRVVLISLLYTPFEQFYLKKLIASTLPAKDTGAATRLDYRDKAIEKKQVFAGVNMKTKKPLYITDEQRKLHVEIVGTTGTGKTESVILPWSYQDIRAGKGSIIIEAKGSVDFCKKLYTLYKQNNCNQRFNFCNLSDPSSSNTYNPLFRGSAVELKDRIMGAFDWSEVFYKNRAESTLLSILLAAESAGKKITFQDLYLLFTEQKIVDNLYKQVKDEFIKWTLGSKVLGDWRQVQKDCSGLVSKLNLMAQGGVAPIINTYSPDIDLLDVYRNNEIVYFCLPTNLIGETAKAFGRMLLMDLRSTAGYIELGQAERHFFPVFVDEFAEFANPSFITWLNKSRSTGIAIHIAHQSFGDLKQVNPSFVQQVIDNTNIKMVFRVNDTETAENFCKQLGTETTLKETAQIDKFYLLKRQGEKGSLREVEEFMVHPNVIKNLSMGHTLIFGKHPKPFNLIMQTDYIPDPSQYIPMSFPKGRNNSTSEGFNFMDILLKPSVNSMPQALNDKDNDVVMLDETLIDNQNLKESNINPEINLSKEYPDQEIEIHQDLIEYDDQHDAERDCNNEDDDKSMFD